MASHRLAESSQESTTLSRSLEELGTISCPENPSRLCARICARVVTFLLPQYESLLNHEFAQFTWESAVELMCDEKQRNRENRNFKSVASVTCSYELTKFLC